MQNNVVAMRFDDTQMTEEESQYLLKSELRIRSIYMLSAAEVGAVLTEVRQWFTDNHKWGFEAWGKARFGYSPDKMQQLMTVHRNLSGIDTDNYRLLEVSFNAQLQLAKAPEPQAAVDEALIRKQIEGDLTAKKAREISEMQRAQQIAKDEARSAQERAEALQEHLNYVNQQLLRAQTAQQTKVVEKKVEFVPEHAQRALQRNKELEERIRTLQQQKTEIQTQAEQLKKQRDFYKRDLEKEREADNDVFLQNLEAKGADRIRANFGQKMRELTAYIASLRMQAPSPTDVQLFGAEEWQRRNEAVQSLMFYTDFLRKLDQPNTVTVQQSMIIDGEVVDSF